MSSILTFSPDLENNITRAVQQSLYEDVIGFTRIQKGEFNYVYKITTQTRTSILRIFRQPNFPENNKLQWISSQLEKQSISHAKILYYSRDNSLFPNGYMISEFIEGINGMDAIENKKISFEQFHEKLAAHLNKIHTIQLKHFGSLISETYTNLVDERIQNVQKWLKPMTDIVGKRIIDDVCEKIKQILLPIKSISQPVLVHSDPTPVNCIYTPEGEVILVDWDGAKSNIWIYDLAWLTFFGSHLSKFGNRKKRRELIIEAFIKTHDMRGYTSEDITRLEQAFHISFAAELLQYYYFNLRDMEAYSQMQNRLKQLLQ